MSNQPHERRFISLHHSELSALAVAAHGWFSEMGPAGEGVIRALDTARGDGPVFTLFLNVYEQDALQRACGLSIAEITAARPIDRAVVAALASGLLRLAKL